MKQVIALDYEALFAPLSDEDASGTDVFSQPPVLSEGEPSLASYESQDTFAHLLEKYFPQGRLWSPLRGLVTADIIHHRLKTIFITMHEAEGQVLLFVDQFHRLLGGERETYPIHAYDILKPFIARGEIQLMGTCTLDQYRHYIGRDALLRRCFQAVYMPDAQEEILRIRTQRDASPQ